MDIREMILERVEYGMDFTALLSVCEAITFIDEFVELDKVVYMEEDFEELCDIMAISLVNGEWYVEDAFYGDEVKYMESDIFFIDRDILEDIDMERLEGSIVIANFESEFEDIYNEYLVNDDIDEEEICECGCCDFDEEYGIAYAMEDIIEDTLIELEDSECDWCAIESGIVRGYKLGYDMALRMMKGAINDILEG